MEAPPSADPLIARYLTMLADQRRYSAHTLRAYEHALTELTALACGRPLASVSAAEIRHAVVKAHAGGLGPRSIAHRLSVWRSFYRWAATMETLPANPVSAVRAPKRPKTLPKALSVDDAARLLDTPRAATPVPGQDARDTAILELFYSSGLRLAELIGLDAGFAEVGGYRSAGWLDLAAREVIVTGKGNRRRIVPIGSKACAALEAWLQARPAWLRDDPHPLFLSVRGARMAPGVVRQRVKQMAIATGIPANVHPHVLRHSFATHVLQSSGDLRAVQEMLGHASIAATQVYTALDFQHLAKIYDAAHPRAKRRQ